MIPGMTIQIISDSGHMRALPLLLRPSFNLQSTIRTSNDIPVSNTAGDDTDNLYSCLSNEYAFARVHSNRCIFGTIVPMRVCRTCQHSGHDENSCANVSMVKNMETPRQDRPASDTINLQFGQGT
ncbi:unnamed protein product [Sphagnum troendelagicum]|uniref:Uncharacterized protein n=1 Tax=Sphagnum troendelagicum TaxID=128251 RepID=A0ABP0T7C3_9BRYO